MPFRPNVHNELTIDGATYRPPPGADRPCLTFVPA